MRGRAGHRSRRQHQPPCAGAQGIGHEASITCVLYNAPQRGSRLIRWLPQRPERPYGRLLRRPASRLLPQGWPGSELVHHPERSFVFA